MMSRRSTFKQSRASFCDGLARGASVNFTTNRTNFHVWRAASLQTLPTGIFRVYSRKSWFKCSMIEHPNRTHSFVILDHIGENSVVIAEFT